MRVVLLLAVVAVVLAVLLPLLRRGVLGGAGAARLPQRDELVKDPVCQTYVVRSRAVTRAGGGAPYFCSAECARRWTG